MPDTIGYNKIFEPKIAKIHLIIFNFISPIQEPSSIFIIKKFEEPSSNIN